MLISKLIKELEAIKIEHGDVEVFAWPYDGQEVHESYKDIELNGPHEYDVHYPWVENKPSTKQLLLEIDHCHLNYGRTENG